MSREPVESAGDLYARCFLTVRLGDTVPILRRGVFERGRSPSLAERLRHEGERDDCAEKSSLP